jgi:molecular chaperone GrpE
MNLEDIDMVTENNDLNINSDAEIPGNTHLSDPLEMREDVDKLTAELQEQKDKYLRQVAEFDNFRRRSAKERMELMQTAGKDIIVALLDVIDDVERAEKQMQGSEDIEQIKQGNTLVFSKLRNILQNKGLAPMESLNTDFDVEKHEAITEIEVPEPQKGKVVDELQKGYYLNDKLIRFAKVVVGK